MQELQNLLISAQDNPSGIPMELVVQKVDEREEKRLLIEEAKKKLQKLKDLQTKGQKFGIETKNVDSEKLP